MKVRVQVVLECDDDGDDHPPVVHEVGHFERGALQIDTLGLQLAEAKDLLQKVQEVVIAEQVRACIAEQVACPCCGRARRHKDIATLVMRTLFGTLRLHSPRWYRCPCTPQPSRTFSPLASILPERTTPELLYLESKFAGLVSYGLSARLLAETLPLGRPLHATAVRLHAQRTAERLEDELGPEQSMFIEGCQRDWDELPRPDLPLVVGLDGGYMHSAQQRSRRDGWFEVIAGKSILAFRRAEEQPNPFKCFAFVETYDEKPKRRLFELLQSQGLQMNQQIEFLSDGGDTVRDVQLYLSPEADHLLDWFHITMRLTTMTQSAKGLPEKMGEEETVPLRDEVVRQLERSKWFLWHGNVFQALKVLTTIHLDLELASWERDDGKIGKLCKAVQEFHTFIDCNQAFIPNYGERYRNGERISTGFVESTVNQVVSRRMVKKQQMRWSHRGAHLLLQIRTRVLNGDWEDVFRRWYPGFRAYTQPVFA
jgi:hypothetical protein